MSTKLAAPSYLASPAALAVRLSRTRLADGSEGPPAWEPAAHHRLLDRRLRDLAARRIMRLVVAMPPRHGKSELCSHWLPVWWLALFPFDSVILLSYESDFAQSWGRRVRDTITEQHHLLTAECEVDEASSAAKRWNTVAGGGMVATSAQGAVTGRGANLLIIDDPYKNREEADSALIRRKVWQNFESAIRTRLAPNAVMLVIQTRWHEEDLAGKLISRGWPVLRLPAIADHRDEMGREIGTDPLGRGLGEALWPSWYDAQALAEIHADVGDYVWSALYQGLPTPVEGGGLWDRDEMDDAYRRFVSWGEPSEFAKIVVGVDPHGGGEGSAAGIVVSGLIAANVKPPLATPKRGVVLADRTTHGKSWSQAAVDAYREFDADEIVAEKNFGGEMVAEVVKAIDPTVPVKLVSASRGKRVRAEPIHELFTQQKAAFADRFPALEDELCRWEPDTNMASPNRLDAMVWALDALKIADKPARAGSRSARESAEDVVTHRGDMRLVGAKYVDKKPR